MTDTVSSGAPADDAAEPARPALPDRLHQRFVLSELIGRGTCSEVYRARDLLLDREAAVKVFPVADDPRVAREVSLLASLDHPSLVAIYDVGEVDGRAFVVMTLLEGGNLLDRLAGGPLPIADTLLAVAAVADGLAHVHRAGVLHRDVTPRNVLFDVDGRAHLSDFGVALVVDAPRITDTGIVVGSAPYLAPEQVRGGTVGAPADVYALGLVMIEALTGRPAYLGTPLEAARARLEHRPALPSGLGADVVALLEAMTADDPADRPGADEVCVGLRRAALAAETSATIAPVAPIAGVGIACAVPSPGAGTPVPTSSTSAAPAPGAHPTMTPAAGTAAAAAVGVPATAAAPAETPFESPSGFRARAAGSDIAANARGLVVVGSVLATLMLAGGVVFASAWTVDNATSLTPPYATVPPATPEIVAVAPGPAPSGSRSSAGSTRSGSSESESDAESTDGGSARPVYGARATTEAEDARPARVTSTPAPTRSTTPPARSTSPTTSTSRSGTPTSRSETPTSTSTTTATSSTTTSRTTTTSREPDALRPALEALGEHVGGER